MGGKKEKGRSERLGEKANQLQTQLHQRGKKDPGKGSWPEPPGRARVQSLKSPGKGKSQWRLEGHVMLSSRGKSGPLGEVCAPGPIPLPRVEKKYHAGYSNGKELMGSAAKPQKRPGRRRVRPIQKGGGRAGKKAREGRSLIFSEGREREKKRKKSKTGGLKTSAPQKKTSNQLRS